MTREIVILVRGLAALPLQFEPLRRALERQGFRAVDWHYNSLRGSIEEHAARLANTAKEFDGDVGAERLHFVGHSMGAIVVRRALAIYRPRKLGRMVLLAPPNRGARLADWALRLLGRRIVAVAELCSDPGSYVNRLAAAPDLDCGVIAASWDEVVPLASTSLPDQRDFIVLRNFHGFLPLHWRTHVQVGHFLRHGRFLRPSGEPRRRPMTGNEQKRYRCPRNKP